MWPKYYRDYPPDKPLIKEQVQPGDGIIGCEMHEINGWGNTHHVKKKKKGFISRFLIKLFKRGDT